MKCFFQFLICSSSWMRKLHLQILSWCGMQQASLERHNNKFRACRWQLLIFAYLLSRFYSQPELIALIQDMSNNLNYESENSTFDGYIFLQYFPGRCSRCVQKSNLPMPNDSFITKAACVDLREFRGMRLSFIRKTTLVRSTVLLRCLSFWTGNYQSIFYRIPGSRKTYFQQACQETRI